ncbi:MAG TPA: zinc ribbon domain-containing protein [Solirubrobacteraceae bacterium]|nr:zinc ribbon domain-containing protein [Solirubrobacteraceae bacterium]
MKPFDPATYLKEVLGPHLDRTELPGLFERYCLDPGDDDDRAIAQRCREVKQLWDKRAEHAKYGGLVRLLLERHDEALLTLEDPSERRRKAAESSAADAERAQQAAQAQEKWEELLRGAAATQGGIDPTMRASLERVAHTMGVDASFASERLDAAPSTQTRSALTDVDRGQIRKALVALAQDTGEPRLGLSLFHALQLPGVTLDVAEIARRQRELDSENAKRKRGNTRVVYETVLVIAKRVLLDGDPRAYIEALVAEVRETLAPDGIRAALNDGAIDELEAERLARRALELGLSAELAQRVVAELARDNGVALRMGATVDYVTCGACSHVAARDPSRERCSGCGAALYRRCPQCNADNDAVADRCGKCGADLRRFTAATRRLAGIDALVHAGRLERARSELEEVRGVLDATPELERWTQTVQTALDSARATLAQAETAIEERRLYAARRLLQDLIRVAGDLTAGDGVTVAEKLTQVNQRLRTAEAALARGRAARGGAQEAAFVEALTVAADCPEATAALALIPPRAASSVEVAMVGADPVVSWRTSPTAGVCYELTRVDSDGARERVAAPTPHAQLTDHDAASGSVVHYEVVALRGSTRSAASTSQPLVVARETQDLAVFNGDGEVRLTWRTPGPRGRVSVVRRDERSGAEQPMTPDGAVVIDRGVRNGERYAYTVRVEYLDPNRRRLLTPGVTVFAQPVAAPQPASITSAQAAAGCIQIAFTPPPNGTVTVLRCESSPTLAAHDAIDPDELAKHGRILESGMADARDPDTSPGARWYVPVTVAGTMAVVGEPFRHLALPGVSNVRLVEEGLNVRVTWTWPDALRTALVAWRSDRQPDRPDDPTCTSRSIRRGEYRDSGGFVIAADGGSLFVSVYPALLVDGELVHAQSAAREARAALARADKTDVHYTIRRLGVRRRKLEIAVSADSTEIPEMLLVARPGDLLPRGAQDGEVIARLGGERPLQSTLDLSGRSRPLALRLFLSTATARAAYRMLDPAFDDLVIH